MDERHEFESITSQEFSGLSNGCKFLKSYDTSLKQTLLVLEISTEYTPAGSRLDDTKLSNGKGDEPTPCVADIEFSTGNSSSACSEVDSRDRKPDPLDVLDRVKINNTLESPISTIKSVLYDSKEKHLSFNKEELRKVESRLKSVFIEFYRKLRFLKHYRW